MAGVVGVDPGPLTLRELALMAEAKRQEAWDHTSTVLAMIFNANRDPKRQTAARPIDFHPLRRPERRGIPLAAANISILKAFAKKGKQQ